MRWLVLVALCGCDQIFGLHETRVVDGSPVFFDRPIDAPFTCPAIGTAPQFSPEIHNVIMQPCTSYTLSAATGRALAECNGSGTMSTIDEGAIDMALNPAQGFPTGLSSPTLVPEGDAAIVTQDVSTVWFTRDTTGLWSNAGTLPFNEVPISNATSGPIRHLLEITTSGAAPLVEWVTSATGTWSQLGSGSLTEVGAMEIFDMTLSADATRLLYYGLTAASAPNYAITFVDRGSLTSPWNPPTIIATPAAVAGSVFMTEDCARLYFSTGAEIAYLQQL